MRAARSLTSKPRHSATRNDRLSQSQISFLKTFDWFFGRVRSLSRKHVVLYADVQKMFKVKLPGKKFA